MNSFVDQEGNKTYFWRELLTVSGLCYFYSLLNSLWFCRSGWTVYK